MTTAVESCAADVRAFIEAKLLDGRRIDPDEELLLSGLLDSLAVMALVAEVERVTGRPVPPTDVLIENFSSLSSITAYMAARQA